MNITEFTKVTFRVCRTNRVLSAPEKSLSVIVSILLQVLFILPFTGCVVYPPKTYHYVGVDPSARDTAVSYIQDTYNTYGVPSDPEFKVYKEWDLAITKIDGETVPRVGTNGTRNNCYVILPGPHSVEVSGTRARESHRWEEETNGQPHTLLLTFTAVPKAKYHINLAGDQSWVESGKHKKVYIGKYRPAVFRGMTYMVSEDCKDSFQPILGPDKEWINAYDCEITNAAWLDVPDIALHITRIWGTSLDGDYIDIGSSFRGYGKVRQYRLPAGVYQLSVYYSSGARFSQSTTLQLFAVAEGRHVLEGIAGRGMVHFSIKSSETHASSPIASNHLTCIATNAGVAQMTVTAQTRQIIWRVQRTADDGASIPNAPHYFFDVDKTKYSAAAKAAGAPPFYRISGTINPSRQLSGGPSGPKIWLDDVSIELPTESRTNYVPIPTP